MKSLQRFIEDLNGSQVLQLTLWSVVVVTGVLMVAGYFLGMLPGLAV